jgi:ribosome-binding factor A
MAQGSRPERVGDLVRTELSQLLLRQVRDPGVARITITHVRMSKDLQQARVFYTGPDSETDRRETARALRRTLPYLRRLLAPRLKLRYVPELAFAYDDSAERQDRILQIFDKIAAERPVESDDSEPISTEEP